MTKPCGLRVRLQQGGGITAPIITTWEVSGGDLSESEQEELRDLSRNLTQTRGAVAGDMQGQTYVLDVEGDGDRRSFTFNDMNIPEAQRHLIRWLKKNPATKRRTS